MKTIIKNLNKLKMTEEHYNIIETLKYIDTNVSDIDNIDDVILVPFYIFNNARYELYYKEFDSDRIEQKNGTPNVKIIKEYLMSILNSEEIKNDVEKAFTSEFDKKNLYFVLY